MSGAWRLIEGDCVERIAAMPDMSVDAIITDPPYGLGFMGRKWDHMPPGREWAEECLRVLKPGGHLLAFGGTRTYHRLTCAIEDAGFEVRDCLVWLYGSGFPKSHNVSKAIDKAAGAEREVIGHNPKWNQAPRAMGPGGGDRDAMPAYTAPATPDAERWSGWGTALKPAHEPIVMARKPLTGTVAGNVLEHGTGALNVDKCRIATDDRWEASSVQSAPSTALAGGADGSLNVSVSETHALGRWPANVLLDAEAAAMLDAQSGELGVAGNAPESQGGAAKPNKSVFGVGFEGPSVVYSDRGGASRFFYVAKASSAERNAGLDGFEEKIGGLSGRADGTLGKVTVTRNVHPTVKPIDLMRWLCRLVTPPGGTVLDPFTGSGTTGCAAVLEGFEFVGIEREPEYAAIAEARIGWWAEHPQGVAIVAALDAERVRKAIADTGQMDLLGEAA